MKIDGVVWGNLQQLETPLFDGQADPGQKRPQKNPEVEARMATLAKTLMEQTDAPSEMYARYRL